MLWKKIKVYRTIKNFLRAPGWLSLLGVWLELRSWSWGLCVRALRPALCWQLRTWSLLFILCLPLPQLALCLSISLKNRCTLNFFLISHESLRTFVPGTACVVTFTVLLYCVKRGLPISYSSWKDYLISTKCYFKCLMTTIYHLCYYTHFKAWETEIKK